MNYLASNNIADRILSIMRPHFSSSRLCIENQYIVLKDQCNVMKFDAVTLQIFMGGTLAEVFGIVFVITKYLFSRNSK